MDVPDPTDKETRDALLSILQCLVMAEEPMNARECAGFLSEAHRVLHPHATPPR